MKPRWLKRSSAALALMAIVVCQANAGALDDTRRLSEVTSAQAEFFAETMVSGHSQDAKAEAIELLTYITIGEEILAWQRLAFATGKLDPAFAPYLACFDAAVALRTTADFALQELRGGGGDGEHAATLALFETRRARCARALDG